MNLRALATALLGLCVFLTSMAGTVAEARMAAAGEVCGTGAPRILVDSLGLPILDAEGEAITAPDCLICTLHVADTAAPPPVARAPIGTITPLVAPVLKHLHARRAAPGGLTRAPPILA